MATRKGGTTPQIDDDFLKNIRAIKGDAPQAMQPLQDQKGGEPSPVAPKKETSDKKTLITAKVNESTLKTWKQFFLDYDLTMTDAIKRAMAHYIKDVRNGTIEI